MRCRLTHQLHIDGFHSNTLVLTWIVKQRSLINRPSSAMTHLQRQTLQFLCERCHRVDKLCHSSSSGWGQRSRNCTQHPWFQALKSKDKHASDELSLLMTQFFCKNLVQKSETTLHQFTTFINQPLMHQRKTTLAYLRQTLSYTHYPLDSPVLMTKENFYFNRHFSFHLNTLLVSLSPPYGKITRQNAELVNNRKPRCSIFFCSLIKEYKNVLLVSRLFKCCCVLK